MVVGTLRFSHPGSRYCLTVRKDVIFEVLLSKAEELGAQLNPAKFVCDFETDFNFCQAGLA
ncbi:hypothetical protein T06_226 [Trichinella sp. T6]|nr:hypothetical protein T06_226 [Trichinella sp. T6]